MRPGFDDLFPCKRETANDENGEYIPVRCREVADSGLDATDEALLLSGVDSSRYRLESDDRVGGLGRRLEALFAGLDFGEDGPR
jgi:hypothetical protein